LNRGAAELEQAKAGVEQQSAERTRLESENRALAEAKDALNLELGRLREDHETRGADLRDKHRKIADAMHENVVLLRESLKQ
jgi:hypothetical protein